MANLMGRAAGLVRRKTLGASGFAARCFARSPFFRDVFFHVAKEFTPGILAVSGSNKRFLVSTLDFIVGREVYLLGDFDYQEAAKAIGIVRQLGLGDFSGKTFVDIGANIGTASLNAVTEFGFARAVSFEPDPRNFRLLSANVGLNGLGNQVVVHNLAVSDQEGTLDFEVCIENSGDGRVRARGTSEPDVQKEGSRGVVAVKAITVDRAFEMGLLQAEALGLVWIDTQGHEGHVLSGAVNSLLRTRAPILMEYWPYGLKRAGGLEKLEQIIGGHFREVIDIRRSTPKELFRVPAADLQSLRASYPGTEFTDLLLLK